MFVVEFSWRSSEVRMGFINRILKLGRRAISRKKKRVHKYDNLSHVYNHVSAKTSQIFKE
jgi:hypothetical protein